MAAEKRNQSGSQSIVDQDAAITAYLDGLLRDPEQDEAPEPSRSRKSPGLTVINTTEAAEPEATGEARAEDGSADGMVDEPSMPEAEVSPSELAAAEAMAADTPEPAAGEALAKATDAPADSDEVAAVEEPVDETVLEAEVGEAAIESEPSETDIPAEAEPVAEPAEASPWAWLRVGGMTLAIPADAVVSRHADAALESVPGAPDQVAGALTVDGRPRLILSLAAVTGARGNGNAAEVLLLGQGGLWGVVGEPAEPPEAFDADAVQWRSESQKAERRGWLAGTHPAAGVAMLDVAGLRAALKGSR